MVLLLTVLLPTAYRPSVWLVWAATLIDNVPPLASVVWDRLTALVPTKTSRVPVMPVAPAVFPRLLAPPLNAPAPRFGALMMIVFELPDRVMLFPPLRKNFVPWRLLVVPAVLAPSSSHAWTYLDVSPLRAAVVR